MPNKLLLTLTVLCVSPLVQTRALCVETDESKLHGRVSSQRNGDTTGASSFSEGVNLYKSGDYNAARLCFWRHSNEHPTDYRSHYYLANSLLELKQYQDAKVWYEKCLACMPDTQTAQNSTNALAFIAKSTHTDVASLSKIPTITPSVPEKPKSVSPLCSPSRDTANSAVTRAVADPPGGLIYFSDSTDGVLNKGSVAFCVKYGLETIPQQTLIKLRTAGYSIKIVPTILDALPRRAGANLRGYGEDSNYDNAAAMFNTIDKQVLIALRFQRKKDSPDYQNNDFSTQAVRHELGHAVDHSEGYPSRSKKFKDAYDLDERKLSAFDRNRFAYFLQPDDNGRSELFAELFAAKYTPGNWQDKKMLDLINAFPDVIPLIQSY